MCILGGHLQWSCKNLGGIFGEYGCGGTSPNGSHLVVVVTEVLCPPAKMGESCY